jgi:type IV fimbrial biogenesis protein FimT
MLNGMQLARAEAVRLNAQVQIVVSPDTSWTVSNAATGTTIQSRSGQQGSSDATAAIQPAGADRVTYNGMGRVNGNADGSSSITQIDVTSRSYVGTEVRPLRLILSAGGMVRMCDPAVASSDPRACP